MTRRWRKRCKRTRARVSQNALLLPLHDCSFSRTITDVPTVGNILQSVMDPRMLQQMGGTEGIMSMVKQMGGAMGLGGPGGPGGGGKKGKGAAGAGGPPGFPGMGDPAMMAKMQQMMKSMGMG